MMPGAPTAALRSECRALCRYLVGSDPSDYVLRCYERSVPSAGPAGNRTPLIDRTLVAVAGYGTLAARVADGYARVFRPYGSLRRRLILLLAILENSPPSAGPLNQSREGSTPGVVAGMAVTLLASGACTLAGIVLLGPVHLVTLLLRPTR